MLQDPSLLGSIPSGRVVYAAPGLNYARTRFAGRYFVFDRPTIDFTTRTIDLSDIADFDARIDWPFTNSQAPLNGLLRIPQGDGPFPLAIFAHGNHTPVEDSTPGYLYLCHLLASHGILAVTIDVNFLNGSNRGENDGRAIVHLEHIKQFRIWNDQAGHPLFRKVDLSNIMIVGHSRGGEAVGHASIFNNMQTIQFDSFAPSIPVDGSEDLGPYNFDLKSIVAIAPTDQQYVPVGGLTGVRAPYMVLHGSRDGDVYTFSGHLAYDRSHRVDLSQPDQPAEGFKSLLWIHGANHNYFNSEWGQESSGTITRGLQEKMAKIFIGALAQAQLLGQSDYLEVLQNPDVIFHNNWVSQPLTLVSQFQGENRLFIQHSEEPGTNLQISSPVSGTVTFSGVTAQKQNFFARGAFQSPQSVQGIPLDSNHHLLQDARGIRLDWTTTGGQYGLELDPTSFDTNPYTHLAFRVGQSFESNNTPGSDQDVTLSFHDGTTEVSLPLSTLVSLSYPDEFPQIRPPIQGAPSDPVTVLQTVLIPLQSLMDQGLNLTQLRRIEFRFDLTPSGTLYLDDVQLVRVVLPSV